MSEKNIGGIAWTVDADTTGATNSVKQMGAQVDKTEAKLKKLDTSTTKTAKGVKKGMAGMSRGAGQAGIQVQQFIGQVQGGQGVMLAFSQQAADVGIVLGAPLVGAVLGISASLVGMLLPSLMGGKTGMELLEKATENVKAAMTLGADGVIEYAAEMKKLKQISDALTEIKLANLISEQNEAFKIGIKETVKLMDDARGKFALGQLFGRKKATEEGINAFVELNKAVEALKLKPTVESMNAVEMALLGMSRAGVDSTKKGRALTSQMGGLIAEYKLGKISIDSLKDALKDTDIILTDTGKKTDEAAKAAETYSNVIKGLENSLAVASRQAVGMKEEARELNAEFEAKKILGGKATEEQIKTVVALLGEVSSAQKDVSERKQGIALAEGAVKQGKSPIERLEEEQAQLLLLKEKYVDQSALFDEALTANSKKQADLRSAYQIANANLILSASSNLFGGLASLLKSSGNEQSNAYKAMFALSKGFAVAQAAMNLSLAISNASAITPWYASLPAVASVVSAGAGLASSIAGATYSGRENGGSVVNGQTYEVGEKNKPEMLMIPGNNGKVFSNSEMKNAMGGGGGGGAPIINNYAAGGGVSVSHRRDELTKRDVFDIVQNEMGNPNSKGRRGLQSNSNVNGVLNGQRRS